MNIGREYRYQKDWSYNGDMYHVRADDWNEFKEAVENMETIIPKEAAFPDDSGQRATPPEQVQKRVDVCPIHKVAMKKYTKDGSSWYSHRLDDGSWCNGKGK